MAILDHPGTHGSDTRPARKASGRKLWAKDPSSAGSADGTRLDATFVNDLVGVLRAVLEAYGVTPTAGDDTVLVQAIQAAIADLAPLDSPELTGTPTAPTADPGTDTTQIATTAYVVAAITAAVTGLINSAPGALDTLDELAAALGDDANFAATVTTALAGKVAASNLASQAEAEAGTDNAKWMSPLRTAEAIAALAGAGVASFNGRTGAVSPASGDYAIADVTGLQTALDLKAPLAAPTFTGGAWMNGAAGTYRLWGVMGGGALRWQWGADNAAEGGSDAGSDWQLHRYNDAGDWQGVPITIKRSNGYIGLGDVFNPQAPIHLGGMTLWKGLGTFAKFQRAGQTYEKWQLALSEANGNLALSMINESTGATISESVQINNGTGKIYNRGVKVLNDEDLASQAQAEAGSDNTVWMSPLRVAQAIAALAGGGIKGLQVLTASGTYTRTSGATKALVIALGGGAGGQTSPTRGGGSGEMRWALVTPAATETATIGAGGSPNGNGGATSLGSLITANGGTAAAAGTGGSGGSQLPTGTGSGLTTGPSYSEGGQGGGNMLGQGGLKSAAGNHDATGYGAGGYADTLSPGSGRPGVLIIIEF